MLNVNQFAQTTIQGQLDLETQGTVLTAQVDTSQATPLVAGQFVKLATTSGGLPKVIAQAANTDLSFGVVVRNLKDQNFPALSNVEIALLSSVMFLTSGGAITRGAAVESVAATPGQVITSGGTNPVAGIALDSASGSGQLIRVYLQVPFAAINAGLAGSVRTVSVTATLAQINAGQVLIPGVTGQKITVLNYTGRVLGAFTTGTSVELESTNGTPVAVATVAEAGLTNGAILTPTESHTTLGAGFSAPLGTGDGLQIVNNGSAQAGGTSITFTFTFIQQ